MQVNFNGHDYLFVNPKLAGQPSVLNENQWVNFGGLQDLVIARGG